MSHINVHIIFIFIFYNYSFFKYLYFVHPFSFSYFFISLLPFYFNITLYISLHLSLSCLLLFTLFYNKFVILSSVFCIVFRHKKVISLSHNFLVDFLFLLHLYFRLINFCILSNSTFDWCNLILYFKLLIFFVLFDCWFTLIDCFFFKIILIHYLVQ